MKDERSRMERYIKTLIQGIDPGPHRAILSVLQFHIGRDQAISRKALLSQVTGWDLEDRSLRICISELRLWPTPICSVGGDGGGYYLPANKLELVEYLSHEVRPKAMDYLEQEKALKQWAEGFWGRFSPEQQIAMF
jgi:hypothetical protein